MQVKRQQIVEHREARKVVINAMVSNHARLREQFVNKKAEERDARQGERLGELQEAKEKSEKVHC